jgi:hypothetical protein
MLNYGMLLFDMNYKIYGIQSGVVGLTLNYINLHRRFGSRSGIF